VGAEGMVTKGANWRSPETKYKRSKIAFDVTSIALSLSRLGPRLLGLAVQSLIGSPGTLIPGILVCDPIPRILDPPSLLLHPHLCAFLM